MGVPPDRRRTFARIECVAALPILRNPMTIRLFWLIGYALVGVQAVAADLPQSTQQFLSRHCVDCHQGSGAEGGLDLVTLEGLSDPQAMDHWVRIFDRVADHEMPPQDADEVSAKQRDQFLSATGAWIADVQRDRQARLGRVQARRLTNEQLQRTLHDLFAIDIPLATLMPEESRTDGFSNIADGQSLSHFQLETHLSVVDAALDEAFRRAAESDSSAKLDSSKVREYSARRLARENPGRRCRDPEMIDGSAVVWSSNLIFYGRITSTTVRESGWYRITMTASAVNKPADHGVWCTVRSGQCTSGAPLMSWIGSFEAGDEPQPRTFEAWIPAGHMLEIRPGDETLRRARFQGGQVGAGEGSPQNVPGVAFDGMTIERIHPGGDVATVRARLFGDLHVDVSGGTLAMISDDVPSDIKQQLYRFARRAFRRIPSDADVAPYQEMWDGLVAEGADPLDALRSCYRAILCSPRFMYFTEPAGPLDDHAIASRLSYLLSGSMPDEQLSRLADEGRLRDAKVLQAEVSRLIAGPRGQRFVRDFASQWLDLVDINFTEPDRKLYGDFDVVVQNAMLDETHAYLNEMLANDRSVRDLIDSQHSYLNSRLARYYGIDGVQGEQLRRVSLSPQGHRGGLMSQGSILKVTANGTDTSPVLRGIWISERILGVPIPPPPASVPAIEPDIRGAKTIREQLQKHLSDSRCASCHKNIDPPGYALENFDAAGKWRDRYMVVSGGRYRRGAEIDASATLADGREFDNFDQFRELLLDDIRPIAKNVAEKLLIYGTGAAITFADRDVVEEIVDATAENDFGFRSLLQAVVTSPTFLSK